MKIIFAFLIALIGFTCQAQKPFYNDKVQNWESTSLPHDSSVVYSVFLVGDAGEPSSAETEPTLQLLKKTVDAANENSTVLFLGDNIYPSGLPDSSNLLHRQEAERRLNQQLDAVKEMKGDVVFIPGNHDWNHWKLGGKEAILRQEKYVENYLNKGNTFLPDGGCPGPKVVKLYDGLVMIVIDSQWYLHDADENKSDGCSIKTRRDFITELKKVFDKYDDGHILLAMHHPPYSNGGHGGYFTPKQHLFPLTEISPSLYIPLPVLGSLYPALRYTVGSSQDIPHYRYQELIQEISKHATFRKKDIIIAAGHEHNLQHFFKKDIHYLVSGGGCKSKPASKNDDALFTHGSTGFGHVRYYQNGEVWLEFISTNDQGVAKISYRHQLEKAREKGVFTKEYKLENDTVYVQASNIYDANTRKEKLLGVHHRSAWAAKFNVPTLNLSTYKGGLIPIKIGGGQQTTSFRLQSDTSNMQYVMRSINKDVAPIVPSLISNTFWQDLVQDQISMAHPYGAFVIPQLADAAKVYHTNPKLFWVPKQERMGDFNSYADQLYLVEERPRGDLSSFDNFGNSKEIISYTKLLGLLKKSSNYRVDQLQVLRSRLFDLWLGDWDRHDDQWRWAGYKNGKKTIFKPIPRDRDQVFIQVDGMLPKALASKWALRQFQHFGEDAKDIPGLSFNSKFFDRAFLNEISLDQYLQMADSLINELTNESIENAFTDWPDTLQQLHAEDIIRKLKSRRGKLKDFAQKHYQFISKVVSVVGTENDEIIEIHRLEEGKVLVEMFKRVKKKHRKGNLLYSRIFYPKQTKEIRIYGLGGKDVFELEGKQSKSILIRIIGGDGKDQLSDQSIVKGIRKFTKIYDSPTGIRIDDETSSESAILTSNRVELNEYDRFDFKFDQFIPSVNAGYNIDDGILLGAGFKKIKQGFKKFPYQSKHQLVGSVALATTAAKLKYRSDYIDLFGKIDFSLNAHAFAPTYVNNFYGFGDASLNSRQETHFYRMRYSQISVFPSFKNNSKNQVLEWRIGPFYEGSRVEKTKDRFISTNDAGLSQNDFEWKHYVGAQLKIDIKKIDNSSAPSKGIELQVSNSYYYSKNKQFNRVHLRFSSYHPIRSWKTVIASRIGYGLNSGDFEIYQAQTLGRLNSIRGYRAQRFSGDQIFFHNLEARITLGKFKTYLMPVKFGVTPFFDSGKVWYNSINDRWITSYGGEVWFALFNAAVLRAGYAVSAERNLLEVGFGYKF